jgi:stage V sporulation protein D (sporulation-specific penicillin-binding protein)
VEAMKKKSKISFCRIVKARVLVLATLSFLLICFLSWGLIKISLFSPTVKQYVQGKDPETVKTILAKRGQILDRNGIILAESVDAHSLYANPQAIKDPEMFAAQVSSIVGVPEKTIVEQIKNEKKNGMQFTYIKRKLSTSQMQDILKIRKPFQQDFGFEDDQRREYPKIQSAASVIGYVGTDNVGLSGLELTYQNIMNGIPGKKVVYEIFVDDRVPRSSDIIQKPISGSTIITTLDYALQNLIEGILDKHIYKWSARGGVAIVMNPRTGEILAMANKPSFDLNQGHRYIDDPEYLNKAVSLNYEPGSIFKPVIASAALEEGIITPMTLHKCSGSVRVADKTVECMIAHGEQNLADIIRNSCNVSFVGIGMKLRDHMYRYAKRFNFGSALPVEIYGQEKGIIPNPKDWYETTVATFSFGQGITATPLQMITSYATIANDGNMMKPQIVKELRDHAGNVVEAYEAKVIRRVISAQTSREMKVVLKNSVQDPRGTHQANIPGMSIGGKTGTAKKVVNGEYADDKVITSFIGFFPVEDPQYVILVTIDEPHPSYEAYGSTVAAPIFKEIVQWMQSHMLMQ